MENSTRANQIYFKKHMKNVINHAKTHTGNILRGRDA